jgi:3-carboxy-cis,cis-muconate cycloisomerase
MSDERSTAARVPDPGIRALFRRDSRWQAWLDVEAALAKAQAELGIIPAHAAEAIARAARLELLDRNRIDEAARRTSHTIVPLVWELARVAGEVGRWVHWGATTQNITQTGDLIVLRHAHRIFLRLIGNSLEAMAELAERGAEMLMPGRTHGQHALPLTFGYKAAVWIDEMLRHIERLQQAEPRVFVAMFGGGAGTFASAGTYGGNQGPAIQARMAAHLDMRPMSVPARTVLDHLAEVYYNNGRIRDAQAKWKSALDEWARLPKSEVDQDEVNKVQKKLKEAVVKLAQEEKNGPREAHP